MGKAAKERLNRILAEHLNTIHETLQILGQTPASSLDKVSWNDVIRMGDQVSKLATTVGMLWTGETLEVKALEENMATYFNMLQGFLLLSHGSTVGAGHTLSSCIHASVKQVVDCSFMLLKECVSSYGSPSDDRKLRIPRLVGTVWDACSALKKIPTTDVTAIGRAMTQIAVSIKDVLREMKELKPASSNQAEENCDEASAEAASKPYESDGTCASELGNDLSHEEMKIAQLTIVVVSETLEVIKELMRSITSLLKQGNLDTTGNSVNTLERLLNLSQGIGAQVDELGACLYPPQEFPVLRTSSEKISNFINEMEAEVEDLKVSSEALLQACTRLRNSLKPLVSELSSSSTDDIEPKMQNLTLNN